MKRFIAVILSFAIMSTFSIMSLGNGYEVKADSTTASDAPATSDITVTNNIKGTYDTVYVDNLSPKDVVKVYNAATGGKLLGSATASSSSLDATVKIAQLGSGAGSVYVSITSTGYTESSRVEADYDAEPVSDAPDSDDITVTNNAKGTYDTVYVDGLFPKDVVKVYTAAIGGKLLGSATASSSSLDATVKIAQIGANGGSVYVSVTSTGCLESSRTEADFGAEPISDAPAVDDITVTNNAKGTYDTVYVDNLNPQDVVKVYNAATGGKLLGSATASSSSLDATVKIAQLGTSAGSVYVTVTSTAYVESSRVEADYSAEPVSDAPAASDITVTNNAKGTNDTVYVDDLSPKDVVKVYNAAIGGKLLGSATASSSSFDATVKIAQLGTAAGSVYVTVTSTACLESSRVEADYAAESVSNSATSNDITVTNNATGTSDTVYVGGLSPNDVVKVYSAATGGTLLGSGTVSSSGSDITVKIAQLGLASGSVYVSVTSTGSLESGRLEANYDAEPVSSAPLASDITVTNNAKGTADTVYVSNLNPKDVVNVYNAAVGGTLLGSATVASTDSDVTVSIAQLGTSAGSVYISVTSADMDTSARTEADYSAESTSTAPSAGNIAVTNNPVGISDTVYVTGLTAGDIVKVYSSATDASVLGKATATVTNATVTIAQLGTSAGSVYVSVTSIGEAESSRTKADYSAESVSTAPMASNIIVTNNAAGTPDTICVSGLQENDIVNVYKAAVGGTTLGTATVASGATYATVSVPQLGTGSGSVYVSVTSTNSLESSRTEADYSAEASSTAPSNIIVTNNAFGTSDTIYVSGLQVNDIVKVYNVATGGTAIGTATVANGATYATVSVSQLGTGSGSVYVSVTSTNDVESSRTEASYAAESQTNALDASNITVTNNAGEADTVVINSGLVAGDIVNVYDAAIGGNLLGTATVSTYSTSATISITQLGTSAGDIYVTLTTKDDTESTRTEVSYSAEAQTTAPTVADVTVNNNYQSASTVEVTGLVQGDIVNIYDSAYGGTLLGTGTVATYQTQLTISVSTLSTLAGTIYVTVTSTGDSESTRTAVAYSAKATSTAPSTSNVTIVNNAGIADTITVTGVVSTGTVINVYSDQTSGVILATATATGTSVTITIDQLGTDAGTVYISATSTGKLESSRTPVPYSAEAASDAILTGNVSIVNNSGSADTITITGLSQGDVVNIYKASSGGTSIATATSTGSLTTTLSISQLGTTAGSIYISVTSTGKTESTRTAVSYAAESTAPSASNITIVNNAGIADTITVTGLNPGDVVDVYNAASNGTLLGTATVSSSSTSVTISVSQLSTTAGTAYVSVTNSGCAQSSLTAASYIAEQTTEAPDEGNIDIVNNYGIDDTVTVYNLVAGDIIKVYDTSSNLLGHATVASGATSGTVSITDLGSSAGDVYVTVKESGKLESDMTEASYSAESQSTAPYVGNITVTNNVSIADTVVVTGLVANDVIDVYDSNETLLGYATVASGSTQATVSISQLGTGSGYVYVAVTEPGKTESDLSPVYYVAETATNAVSLADVTIVNNPVGTPDTITVTGLNGGDLIQVYDAATGGNFLGSATVASSATSATLTITQLGVASGSVYISITSIGKSESDRTQVNYAAEQ
jgi:hypothetical protein